MTALTPACSDLPTTLEVNTQQSYSSDTPWSNQCQTPTLNETPSSRQGSVENTKHANKGAMSTKRGRTSPGNIMNNKTKQSKISNYWLSTPSTNNTNRFSLLDGDETSHEIVPSPPRSEPKPPPIFVSGVHNITPLKELLLSIAKGDFVLKILGENEVKIQPKTAEKYSIITKALTEKKTEFHTFKLKQDRGFNVVLKGMHHSSSVDDIRQEIEHLGHKVVNICNMRQRVTKKPLPLFYISLKVDKNNKDIYACENLLHTKIKFEAPRKKREIPQCTRCQRYGHTKHFCNRSPRCVKCTGNHLTTDCLRKGTSKEVKCVLCEGNHPANYKGCAVYKELQQKTHPTLRTKNLPMSNGNLPQSAPQIPMSYAAAVKTNLPAQQPQPSLINNNPPKEPNDELTELKSLVKSLVEQMSTVLNLLTTLLANQTK